MSEHTFSPISSFLLGLAVAVFAGALFFFTIFVPEIQAQVSFPVAALGNCGSKEACKAYCDVPENRSACIAFAESQGLVSREQAERAHRVVQVTNGPGGCNSHQSCEAYCDNIAHIEECMAFAEREGIVGDVEVREARAVASAIRAGATPPGGCTSKAACEAYCDEPSHMPECLAFAEAAGLMSSEELQEARKVSHAIEQGHTPPGNCRGRVACEAYCQNPDNAEECFAFARAAGFISEEEAEHAERILPLLQRGETPGGCTGRAACEAYCQNPDNAEECLAFARRAGLIPDGQERHGPGMMDGGPKGPMPGGCDSPEACAAYCENPAHQEECDQFFHDPAGFGPPPYDGEHPGEFTDRSGPRGPGMPPEIRDCVQEIIGAEVLAQLEQGDFSDASDLHERMRPCFERAYSQQEEEFSDAPPPPPDYPESGERSESGLPYPPQGYPSDDDGHWDDREEMPADYPSRDYREMPQGMMPPDMMYPHDQMPLPGDMPHGTISPEEHDRMVQEYMAQHGVPPPDMPNMPPPGMPTEMMPYPTDPMEMAPMPTHEDQEHMDISDRSPSYSDPLPHDVDVPPVLETSFIKRMMDLSSPSKKAMVVLQNVLLPALAYAQ